MQGWFETVFAAKSPAGVATASMCEFHIGVKRNYWLANFPTLRHVRMHRVIFYILNTLTKLVIRVWCSSVSVSVTKRKKNWGL